MTLPVPAFLWGQLEAAEAITAKRLSIWDRYHEAFADLEDEGVVQRPVVPPGNAHNGHLYYLVLPSAAARNSFIDELRREGIATAFHYVPLHDAPAGVAYGRVVGTMGATEDRSARLVRLPLWADLDVESVERVVEASTAAARAAAVEPA